MSLAKIPYRQALAILAAFSYEEPFTIRDMAERAGVSNAAARKAAARMIDFYHCGNFLSDTFAGRLFFPASWTLSDCIEFVFNETNGGGQNIRIFKDKTQVA